MKSVNFSKPIYLYNLFKNWKYSL